jgi:cholesterol transport system auxiliary component
VTGAVTGVGRWGLLPWVLAAALSACTSVPVPPPAVYDFGPAPASTAPAGLPGHTPASLQVLAPPWLDGTAMLYRLGYGDGARLSSYRDSRWAAAPGALLHERLKQQLARAPGTPGAGVLRVEVEEFCQVFDTPERSRGVVRLRAALLEPGGSRVLRQAAFAVDLPAATADAPGGAHALMQASDQVLARTLDWALAP